MAKKLLICCLILLMGLFAAACKGTDTKEEKLRDVEFTIVPEKDIPKELFNVIEEAKTDVMKKTFSDRENLYIVIGYGRQDKTGYSIAVKELYETKNVIKVKTWLIGPSKTDSVADIDTYPYVVIKIEHTDKPVVFK